MGAVGRGGYEARVRELLEHSDPIFSVMIEAMLDVRRAIFEGYERLHRVLLQVVQHDAVCRRLMTVPGVGPVAALSFKVGVDDPRRFARSRTVGAHFGLTPRRSTKRLAARLTTGRLFHARRFTLAGCRKKIRRRARNALSRRRPVSSWILQFQPLITVQWLCHHDMTAPAIP
jgi:transposase